ncbi:hypothetical protein BpHYR1_002861 [Brachionus plicatilis]|uniref:Uncharacterized protein n=1 Tax=Brachionus plicatilis TaxID=10195 RepID=A0A3M7PDT2_BRAPC|nr:hypothetical protein BpHYR1_002861 [Brachionus plicatilis]
MNELINRKKLLFMINLLLHTSQLDRNPILDKILTYDNKYKKLFGLLARPRVSHIRGCQANQRIWRIVCTLFRIKKITVGVEDQFKISFQIKEYTFYIK